MRPITVLGLAWMVGVLIVGWMTFALAHALAADASFVERESRSQQVIVVKPDGRDQPSEAGNPPDKTVELKREISEEKRRSELLVLKLNAMRERVKAEWARAQRDERESSNEGLAQPEGAQRPDRRDRSPVVGATESGDVVREYIWIPPHREGGRLIEGHYKLRTE
jgi:hypothetical protein